MKHLGHKGIGPNDTLPKHFGTNNRLMAELQKIAERDIVRSILKKATTKDESTD